LVCEEELSDPRHQDHGPSRVPSFGHQFGALHQRIVDDDSRDDSFHSGISNRAKVAYMCDALRLNPANFNLDQPFPVEDWACSDSMALYNCGLYLCDLRRQFYAALIGQEPSMERSTAWVNHAEAEHWNHQFNRLIYKRGRGVLLDDPRVLN
jgi:hypothetical protein